MNLTDTSTNSPQHYFYRIRTQIGTINDTYNFDRRVYMLNPFDKLLSDSSGSLAMSMDGSRSSF